MHTIQFSNPYSTFICNHDAYIEAFQRVLNSKNYILGTEVNEFENEFSAWLCNNKFQGSCVGVASGTDALEIALRGLLRLTSIPSNKLPAVFTVSHTAVATISAIERAQCVPVLVDIDEISYTISPFSLKEAIKDVIKNHQNLYPVAIIPVHLYGHPCNMDEILSIAQEFHVRIIEDCAQAHGAVYKGKKVGTIGDVGAFSFYPTKNLGTLGDAGAVFTKDAEIACEMQTLRQYGWKERYISSCRGINSRLDPIQAAFLRINLTHLDQQNNQRQAIAQCYDSLHDSSYISLPNIATGTTHAFHLYVVRTRQRDALIRYLAEKKINTGIHYPHPIHKQPAYINKILSSPTGLPITERICTEILSLPMYPGLSNDDMGKILISLRCWDGGSSNAIS